MVPMPPVEVLERVPPPKCKAPTYCPPLYLLSRSFQKASHAQRKVLGHGDELWTLLPLGVQS